jgi:hypothetical protein
MIEQVAWNKSSVLLKIQILNGQTLQLFIMSTNKKYKSYSKCLAGRFGRRDLVVKLKDRGSAIALS